MKYSGSQEGKLYSLVLRFCSQDVIVKKIEYFCRINGPDYLPGRELTMNLLPQFTLKKESEAQNLLSVLHDDLVDFFFKRRIRPSSCSVVLHWNEGGKKRINYSLMLKFLLPFISRESEP